MQIGGFNLEYFLFDFSCQRILTNQLMFDIGSSFSSFDFGVNFSYKGCLHHGFVFRLEPLLPHIIYVFYIYIYIYIYVSVENCYCCYGNIHIYKTYMWDRRGSSLIDGNYTRMLWAILNKSWRHHPTRHQLYGHLPPITKTIPVRRTRLAGHCWRSKDELISDVLLWTLHMAKQKQDDFEHTYSSYVRI